MLQDRRLQTEIACRAAAGEYPMLQDRCLQTEFACRAAAGEYPSSHPRPGWSEQNPDDWWRVLGTVLAELRRRPEWPNWRIAALALDSYTHGAVLLDEHLDVIRPTILWTDQRAAPECQALDDQTRQDIFRITFQMPTPTWTLPQMMWLRKQKMLT